MMHIFPYAFYCGCMSCFLEQEQPGSDARGVRIAADVGGTFTDLVIIDAQGTVRREKSLSTPPDFEKCVLETIANVLAKHRLDPASVRAVQSWYHGRHQCAARAPGGPHCTGHNPGIPGRSGTTTGPGTADLRSVLRETSDHCRSLLAPGVERTDRRRRIRAVTGFER